LIKKGNLHEDMISGWGKNREAASGRKEAEPWGIPLQAKRGLSMDRDRDLRSRGKRRRSIGGKKKEEGTAGPIELGREEEAKGTSVGGRLEGRISGRPRRNYEMSRELR